MTAFLLLHSREVVTELLQNLNIYYNMALLRRFPTPVLQSNFLQEESRTRRLLSLTKIAPPFFSGGKKRLKNSHRVRMSPAINIYPDFN